MSICSTRTLARKLPTKPTISGGLATHLKFYGSHEPIHRAHQHRQNLRKQLSLLQPMHRYAHYVCPAIIPNTGMARRSVSSTTLRIGSKSTSRPSGECVAMTCFIIELSSDELNILRSFLTSCCCCCCCCILSNDFGLKLRN